jgi:ribosomal protein RSM22 (predicted rRNA methylase)
MDPRTLVRPLEPRWEAVLDAVLRSASRTPLAIKDVARLAPKVAELSAAYNAGRAEGRRTKLPMEARVAFSFPRDVPKGAAAVRELVASRVLQVPPDRPLRVVDLGAGLGAMTWGLARALGASGARGRIAALLVDEDPAILQAAEALTRAAGASEAGVELAVTTRLGDVSLSPSGLADVVLVGQVLSEIDPGAEPRARVDAQTELLRRLLHETVAPDGALVIIEPALRDRTRHLHAIRDRLLELDPAARVFAPCLHSSKCPALALDGEWCHEDLAVDLPEWLVPLARAAGLRWQGLTFSYLVLRRDGRGLGCPSDQDSIHQIRFRAVSELLRSKGKAELWSCSDQGVRARLRRLERDAAAGEGLPFEDLRRGDVVTVTSSAADPASPVDDRGRLAPHVRIEVGTDFL